MKRVRIELCYDGAGYSGWQIQPKQPKIKTIQGELEKAIFRVVGRSTEVVGSGRTDAGVHALCQTAAFNTDSKLPPETLARAINAFLPCDIRIWRASYTSLDFHPIYDVIRKRYRYLVSDSRPSFPFFRRNVWNLIQRIDVDIMKQASRYLLGTHDMKAFQTQGSPRKTTERTIFDLTIERTTPEAAFRFPKLQEWERATAQGETGILADSSAFPASPELVVFEVEANGFLYNMARAIVGTLRLFGERHKGFEDPTRMKEIVEKADRRLAGPTAPPHGLYLVNAVYPDDPDETRSLSRS